MTEAGLRRALIEDGLPPGIVASAAATTWSAGPGERFAVHGHDFDKVLLVQAGSITFQLAEAGRVAELAAGDRLDLPAGTDHSAVAGSSGVRCLELHLAAGSLP